MKYSVLAHFRHLVDTLIESGIYVAQELCDLAVVSARILNTFLWYLVVAEHSLIVKLLVCRRWKTGL